MNDTKNPVNGRINEAKDAFLTAMAEEGMIDADHILQPDNLKYVSGLLDDLCTAAMNAPAAQPHGKARDMAHERLLEIDALVRHLDKGAGHNNCTYDLVKQTVEEASAASTVIAELVEALEGLNPIYMENDDSLFIQAVAANDALTRARAYQNGQPATAPAGWLPVPPGWRYYTSDFSIQGNGHVMLKRVDEDAEKWFKLSDAMRDTVCLYLTGRGKTVREAWNDVCTSAKAVGRMDVWEEPAAPAQIGGSSHE